MNDKVSFQRLIQFSIILICVTSLYFQFSYNEVIAQSCWPNVPALTEPSDPLSKAWPRYQFVTVTIFDVSDTEPTSQADFDAIDTGIRDWNNYKISGCSSVTHSEAIRAGRGWLGQGIDIPPSGAIYVVRTTDRSGQFVNVIQTGVGVVKAWLYLRSDYTYQTPSVHMRLHNLAKHEAGHGFGIENASFDSPPSVMAQNSLVNDVYEITSCDVFAHRRVYCPTPTPSPSPTPWWGPIGGCNGPTFENGTCSSGFVASGGGCVRSNSFINQCSQNGGDYDPDGCGCTGSCQEGGGCSPIVVDVLGDGISLTDATNGVNFNLDNIGSAERRGWTSGASDDAWLALDRNGDGLVDRGRELFGNVTAQEPAPSGQMNGFRALALFDQPGYGGNGDGKINASDAVFPRLRLWQDQNHNGVSESCEMFALPDLGLIDIDLNYKSSNQVDEHGNQFRFRTKVTNARGPSFGRWAWDVFLVVQQ